MSQACSSALLGERPRPEGEGKALIRALEAADLIVVGTPVYRASYTGALKHVFDLLHKDSLAGKPAVLAATGGSALHGLVTEHQLRPLLALNPFTALVEAYRDVLLHGVVPLGVRELWLAAVSVAVFSVGATIFTRARGELSDLV